MVDSLERDYAVELLAARQGPCLSLYQPTHRRFPENQQDPIRFRNLLKSFEASLGKDHGDREVQRLLGPFRKLVEDHEFWSHNRDGLAVLAAPDFFRVYRLQRPVPALAVVAMSFHVKPLLRIQQSADRYQVLGLNRREVKLFEGNRDVLDEAELARGVPRTITDALGEQLTEPHLRVASYGGLGGPGMYHGHGGKKEEVDIDTERFFRAVDRAVLEHHSRTAGLPLVLAALPEHHGLFRHVSHNPHLVAEGIDTHPDALTPDALRERAWRVIEPRYLAKLAALIERFGQARSKGLGMDDLADVAAAAATGRVATLLIDADQRIPGRIDTVTGRIEYADLSHADVDDLLDDLAQLVLSLRGEVVVVPTAQMPTATGAAAICRF